MKLYPLLSPNILCMLLSFIESSIYHYIEKQHSHIQSSSQSFASSQYSSYGSLQHKKCSRCCPSMPQSYTSRKYKGHHHHAHLQSYIFRQSNQHHCSHSKFQTSPSRQNNLLSHPHSNSQSYTPHSQNSRHVLLTVSPRRKSRRNRSHPQYPRNRHCNTSHPHILQKIKVLNKRVLCHSAWRHKKKYISRVLCRRMRQAHLSGIYHKWSMIVQLVLAVLHVYVGFAM